MYPYLGNLPEFRLFFPYMGLWESRLACILSKLELKKDTNYVRNLGRNQLRSISWDAAW